MHVAEILTHRTHRTSGVLGAVTDLAVALADADHAVQLYVPRGWTHGPMGGPERMRRQGVEVEVVEADSLWSVAARIGDRVNASGCDVAHLHNGFSPMNNLVARRLGVPYVVTTHGVYATESLRHHAGRKQLAIRLTERRLLRRASAVTALTEVEASELAALAPGLEATVVPLGFSPAPADPDRVAFRHEVGFPPDGRLAVYGGRMDIRAKRLDAAVRGLVDAPDWHLALVGGDYDNGRRALREIAVAIGVADRVHLLDHRQGDAYTAVLAAADVVVLLSRSEGLPRGLVEAMLVGTPCIVSPEVNRRIDVDGSGAGVVASAETFGAALAGFPTSGQPAHAALADRSKSHAARYLWREVIDDWTRVLAKAGR